LTIEIFCYGINDAGGPYYAFLSSLLLYPPPCLKCYSHPFVAKCRKKEIGSVKDSNGGNISFVRLLALRPLLAYCASLG
jgi:hypothetical protein